MAEGDRARRNDAVGASLVGAALAANVRRNTFAAKAAPTSSNPFFDQSSQKKARGANERGAG